MWRIISVDYYAEHILMGGLTIVWCVGSAWSLNDLTIDDMQFKKKCALNDKVAFNVILFKSVVIVTLINLAYFKRDSTQKSIQEKLWKATERRR